MSATIKSGVAAVKVMESWGVDHLYGLPGGSINSMVNALYECRDTMRYIQIRHEESGALAASVDAKLNGRVGVCFGSAGPGATHLFNGLYDAKMDKVPVLALVGQVASTAMNKDSFQELNENPMFTDVSVYNRTVMTPESLPFMIDEAIRMAVAESGVSVVTIPVDYGFVDIPAKEYSSAKAHRTGAPYPDARDVAAAAKLIGEAERPVLYVGQGGRGAKEEILALSEHYAMPIVLSVLAKGIIPDAAENFMGMAARIATKPANEALTNSDLIVFVGSDFPFARFYFPEAAKMVQIDVDPSKFGKRHGVDVAILGDARESMRQLREAGPVRQDSGFLKACQENRRNWMRWLGSFAESNQVPLRVEPVFAEINRVATEDAIFVTDVGNTTLHAVRMLDMNGDGQRFTTSGLFATMGYGVPGGIAAKLSYPDRQVFTLNGDGAFAMSMQDVITQVRYGLPVINVVFTNQSLGFIEPEQEDAGQPLYGVDLEDADFAKAGEAMGAVGFRVRERSELPGVFDQAVACDKPVVIDIKIDNKRPFPAEAMVLDQELYGPKKVADFQKRYEVENMPLLRDLMIS